jgi:hypothetical protein
MTNEMTAPSTTAAEDLAAVGQAAADLAEAFPLDLDNLRQSQQRFRERFNSTSVTELPSDYAKRLNAASGATPADESTLSAAEIIEAHAARQRRQAQPVPIAITYDTAAELYYLYLKGWLQREGKETIHLDRGERPIIQNLIRWAIQSNDCEYDLTKGIYLHGRIGTGKTMLMHAMQYVADAARLHTQYRIVKTTTIADTIKAQAYADERNAAQLAADLRSLHHGHWCFDDLGEDNEPISIKLWGNDTPIMSPLLSARYDAYLHQGLITHVTSNLRLTSPDPDETTIETRYGTRIKDRLKTMFNFILLDGDSRRG